MKMFVRVPVYAVATTIYASLSALAQVLGEIIRVPVCICHASVRKKC